MSFKRNLLLCSSPMYCHTCPLSYTHIHTHTHMLMYIYKYKCTYINVHMLHINQRLCLTEAVWSSPGRINESKVTRGKKSVGRDSFPSIFFPFSSYQYYFIFSYFPWVYSVWFPPPSFSVWLLITLSAFSNAIWICKFSFK